MDKYIELEAAKDAARRAERDAEYDGRKYTSECVADALDFTPAADVAPVVRCKDCKYSRGATIDMWGQPAIECHTRETHSRDWFCANGEKRIEGEKR